MLVTYSPLGYLDPASLVVRATTPLRHPLFELRDAYEKVDSFPAEMPVGSAVRRTYQSSLCWRSPTKALNAPWGTLQCSYRPSGVLSPLHDRPMALLGVHT